MIIDLPATTTSVVNKALVDLRETGGAIALGRVLTLIIVTDDGEAEEAIAAANDASREHPCRIIALVRANRRGTPRLDAQVRVGGDAGASEVVVLRLYGKLVDHAASVAVPLLLPDAPVVAWWPAEPPKVPADDPIGAMAQRRITDAAEQPKPLRALDARRDGYRPGDTDLAWTRTTLWRGLLAAALDQPPFDRVTGATVVGAPDSPSTDLLAAWLAFALRCPVTRARARSGQGLVSVRLERRGGPIDLVRPDGSVATLVQPGQPDRRIALARRTLSECLAEELRRLDPDEIYAEALVRGLPKIVRGPQPSARAVERAGGAMPEAEAVERSEAVHNRERLQAAKIHRAEPEGRRPPREREDTSAGGSGEASGEEPDSAGPARATRSAARKASSGARASATTKTSGTRASGTTKKAATSKAASTKKAATSTSTSAKKAAGTKKASGTRKAPAAKAATAKSSAKSSATKSASGRSTRGAETAARSPRVRRTGS